MGRKGFKKPEGEKGFLNKSDFNQAKQNSKQKYLYYDTSNTHKLSSNFLKGGYM